MLSGPEVDVEEVNDPPPRVPGRCAKRRCAAATGVFAHLKAESPPPFAAVGEMGFQVAEVLGARCSELTVISRRASLAPPPWTGFGAQGE